MRIRKFYDLFILSVRVQLLKCNFLYLFFSLGYDVPVLSQYLDWISVMTYDYHGQWDKITGHVAPMYLHPDDVDVTFHAVSIN